MSPHSKAEELYKEGLKKAEKGNFIKAIRYYERSLKEYHEKSPRALIKISLVYLAKSEALQELNKFEEALESINLALKYQPYSSRAKEIKQSLESRFSTGEIEYSTDNNGQKWFESGKR